MVRADRSAAVAAAVALAVIAVAGLAIFAIPASEVPLTYRAASPVARVARPRRRCGSRHCGAYDDARVGRGAAAGAGGDVVRPGSGGAR